MAPKQVAAKKRPRCRPHPPTTNAESFKNLQEWFGDEAIFSRIKLHGKVKWTATYLVWLALCWAWSEARCLTDAFSDALAQ